MGEVSESEGVASQGFQAAVDGFGGSVGGVVLEERQHVGAAPPQGVAQLCQFVQPGRYTAPEGVDDRGQHGLAAGAVGLAVRGDDVLVDAPGNQDWQVVVISEQR